MSDRKQVLLRIDPAVHDALARWAEDEFRSLNAQIEMLLRRALDDAGRMPQLAGPTPAAGAAADHVTRAETLAFCKWLPRRAAGYEPRTDQTHLPTIRAVGLFKKSGSESPVDPPAPRPEPDATLNLPAQLLWLLDAPLFIDNDQVEAFYDAILRPDYEHTSLTLSKSLTNETTIGTQATIGAALPWFGKAQIQASGDFARSSGRGSEVALAPISNTYRHLLALALHYAAPSTPSRLIAKSPPVNLDDEWLTPEYLTALPRAMVFLELPARTKLLPAACECSGEAVAVLADKVEDSLRRQGLDPLRYPGSSAPEDEKNRYYQFLADHYNDHDVARDHRAGSRRAEHRMGSPSMFHSAIREPRHSSASIDAESRGQ